MLRYFFCVLSLVDKKYNTTNLQNRQHFFCFFKKK